MLYVLRLNLFCVMIFGFGGYSFAADVSKYQEPTQAEKNRIGQQIQEQLKGAEQVSQDPEFLKNIDRATSKVKSMKMPTSMPMINVREEDISPENAINPDQLSGAASNVVQENRMSPLVLVSLSMPEDALRNLTKEASRLDSSVTFRGVKSDNLKVMRNEFMRMGIEAQIDPSFFIRFGVTEVPTFILPLEPVALCDAQSCPTSRHVKVSGLVSIESALEFISRNSKEKDAKEIAEQWLEKLRNKS